MSSRRFDPKPTAIFMFVCAALTASCTSLTAQGEGVRHVDSTSAVKGCRSLGRVTATPPYGLPDDWKDQLRNETALLGGNTVYAPSPGLKAGNMEGEAYACPDPRTSRR